MSARVPSLHIGVCGPIATRDAAPLLRRSSPDLPTGVEGAPLLVTLIAELLRRGHRVSAFTVSTDMPLESGRVVTVRGRHFELHLCPGRPRAWPPNGWRPGRIVDLYAFERAGLRRALRAAAPDVVHAHWTYEFAWAALQSGLPHVVTCHDSPLRIARFERDLRHGGYRWLRAAMAWHVLRQARSVTTVSPYMAAEVQPLCRVPVVVIPNPIDVGAARPAGLDLGAPGRATRIVLMVFNGWGPRKNVGAGLEAYAQLATSLDGIELHLYGTGTEPGGAAERHWQAMPHRAGGVVFHGPVSHADLLAATAGADVLLHPALEESFGAVVAEAMALGVPVVAGRLSGAIPWLVGGAGLLVDAREPTAMAKALHAILGDARVAADLGRLGRFRAASHFSVEAVADAYELEYAKVLMAPDGCVRVPA